MRDYTSGTTGNVEALTIDKLNEAIGLIRPLMPKHNPMDDLLTPSFMGIKIFENPALDPKPKIQVRDIKFSDGTSILPPEFLAEQNRWWAKEFGYREHVAYMFGGNMLMGLMMAAKLINFT